MEKEPDFYSVTKFAEKLAMHPNTVRKAIEDGHISACRLTTASKSPFRIPSSEIIRIMEFKLEEVIEKEVQKRLEGK